VAPCIAHPDTISTTTNNRSFRMDVNPQEPIMIPNSTPITIVLGALDYVLRVIKAAPLPANESFPVLQHLEQARKTEVDKFIAAWDKPPAPLALVSNKPLLDTREGIIKDVIDEVASRIATHNWNYDDTKTKDN